MTKPYTNKVFTDETFVRSSDNCLHNTMRGVKAGVTVGTFAGIAIATNNLHLSILENTGRAIARCIFPSALLAGMFASTTCIMDEMRGHDKPVSNGFIGGAMAGMVLGTKSHSMGKVASLGFLFGLGGAALRFYAVDGFIDYDVQARYNDLNKSLNMGAIRHLDPYQTGSQKN